MYRCSSWLLAIFFATFVCIGSFVNFFAPVAPFAVDRCVATGQLRYGFVQTDLIKGQGPVHSQTLVLTGTTWDHLGASVRPNGSLNFEGSRKDFQPGWKSLPKADKYYWPIFAGCSRNSNNELYASLTGTDSLVALCIRLQI